MSFQFHPGAYESANLKHQDLIAEAEKMRRLAAVRSVPTVTIRTRAAIGHWLIALGERVARPAHSGGRA